MMYAFESWMYKHGTQSHCYVLPATRISSGDSSMIAARYPILAAAAAAVRHDRKALRDTLLSHPLSAQGKARIRSLLP
jgi:hypothetical protein